MQNKVFGLLKKCIYQTNTQTNSRLDLNYVFPLSQYFKTLT